MASEQITLSEIFKIKPDFIDSDSEDNYLCERSKLSNGRVAITIYDKKTSELIYEEIA